MNNLNSILTLNQSADAATTWTTNRLREHGFEIKQTFNLKTAQVLQDECSCPHHGSKDCTCQMVILLAYTQSEQQPVTIVIHGRDGKTCLSLADSGSKAINENIIHVLMPAQSDFQSEL